MARYTEADLSDEKTLVLRDGDVLDLTDCKTTVTIPELILSPGAKFLDPKRMATVGKVVADLSHLVRDSEPIDAYVTMSGQAKVGDVLEVCVAGDWYKITVHKLGPQWYQIGDKEVCIQGIE